MRARDFVIGYSQGLLPKDFVSKDERMSRSRKGKRQYLKDALTRQVMVELDEYFQSRVEIPAIKHGKTQADETLIGEEALLLAKYLRDETESYDPRVAMVN